jgi:hypothetical protein
MLTDDDEKRIERIVERVVLAVLAACGIEKLPSAAALRMRRMREQKRNKAENKSVTRKGNGRNKAVTGERTPTSATWQAYATAYRQRYGVDPVRNRQVNGMLANVVERLGAEEAPAVAEFYVRSQRGLYLSAKHAVNLLSKHAEALRTEWATGQAGTDTEARQADRTAALGNAFHELLDEAKNGPH